MKTLTATCVLFGAAFLSAQAITITFDGHIVTSQHHSAEAGKPFRAVFYFPDRLLTSSGGSSWSYEWMLNYEWNLNPDVEFLPWPDLRVTWPGGAEFFDQVVGVLTVEIQNDGPSGDSIRIHADLDVGFVMGLYLSDPSGTALDSAGFPAHLPAADWPQRTFFFAPGIDANEWYGQIDRITVPDSGNTLSLMALSLSVFLLARQWRGPDKALPGTRSGQF